ncbi:MAG: hypothetical protein ABI807_02325 [Sporichthyaceae bacterium]
MTAYGRDTRAGALLDRTARALRRITARPLLLAEVGASGPRQAAFVANLGRWVARHPSVRGLVWSDTSPATTGATGDFRLRGAGSIAASGRLTRELDRRGSG